LKENQNLSKIDNLIERKVSYEINKAVKQEYGL
jgi:hypothetical protein